MSNSDNSKIFDCLIIGAGPAGMTAALYGTRGNINVGIIDKLAPGGKVLKTSEIENYPGFKIISGPDLSLNMFNQLLELNIPYIPGNVSSVEKKDDLFILKLSDNTILKSKTVISATGTKERLIGVPGEEDFYGKGVSYCAVCDAALYRNQTIVVVGGGNSAVEEALYLSRYTTNLILIHRRQGFRAFPELVEKLKNNKNIKLLLDCVLVSIEGKDSVNNIKYKDLITNKIHSIKTNIIFPFIGSDPVTSFLKKFKILDKEGYIIANNKMETSVKGLYAAGDANQKPLRQIVTAVNDGGIAAQEVIHLLTS